MKTPLIFIALLMLPSLSLYAQSENAEAIALSLRTGNAKELSKHFGTTVSIKILTKEDVYSKAQAEQVMKDFFSKNPPSAYVARHHGTSKTGAQYTIGQLTTANGNFRTYYFLKKHGDQLLIQEFRIESEE